MVQLTESQFQELQAIANNENGQRDRPFADAYDFIVNILSDGDNPAPGVDPAVWNWFRGGADINRGVGFFSEFIRAYTTEQAQIRQGSNLSLERLQQASDEVLRRVIDNLERDNRVVPTINDIGRSDASAIGDCPSSYNLRHISF